MMGMYPISFSTKWGFINLFNTNYQIMHDACNVALMLLVIHVAVAVAVVVAAMIMMTMVAIKMGIKMWRRTSSNLFYARSS